MSRAGAVAEMLTGALAVMLRRPLRLRWAGMVGMEDEREARRQERDKR